MKRLSAPILAFAVGLALLAGTPSAQGREELPVSYNFLASAVAAGLQVDADPPGANDFNCRPSRRHPRPVVLVHGTVGNKNTNWQTYAPLLANEGYCVFALTYGVPANATPGQDQFGGMANMKQSAEELARFVARVRKATGAAKVDLIGHSQGTLMPQYYAKFLGGARFIRHYISLAPLWKGTQLAEPVGVIADIFGVDEEATPACTACSQFRSGSRFMRQLRAGGLLLDGVRYTNIVTKYDQLVQPYTSGIEPGMRNVVLQDRCELDLAEHFEIAADPIAARIVLNTLDPERKQPVPCIPVLPYVGPPSL